MLMRKEQLKGFFDPVPKYIDDYWDVIDKASLHGLVPFWQLGFFSSSLKKSRILASSCAIIEDYISSNHQNPGMDQENFKMMGVALGRIVFSDRKYARCFIPYWMDYSAGRITPAKDIRPATMLAGALGPFKGR